jgi:hypothetical protein
MWSSKAIRKITAAAVSLLIFSIYQTAFFEPPHYDTTTIDLPVFSTEGFHMPVTEQVSIIGIHTSEDESGWKQRPGMIQITKDLEHARTLPLQWELAPTVKRRIQWNSNITAAPLHRTAKPLCGEDDTDCEIMGPWQESNNMTCNPIHEIDLNHFFVNTREDEPLENIRYVTRGSVRVTWGFRDFDGTKRALKMLRLFGKHDFTPELIDMHRLDAVVNEAVSASPYIVSIYGYCALSTVYEFCNGGSLKTNVLEKGPPPRDEMLRIAHRIAASIADLHHVDEFGRATIMHKDVHSAQWLMVDGEYRLTDFNYAQLLTWSWKTNSTVPYRRKKPTIVRTHAQLLFCLVIFLSYFLFLFE